MYKWNFSIVTLEKGRIHFQVSAKDKQSAIEKAFKKARKMNLSLTPYWDCRLAQSRVSGDKPKKQKGGTNYEKLT